MTQNVVKTNILEGFLLFKRAIAHIHFGFEGISSFLMTILDV